MIIFFYDYILYHKLYNSSAFEFGGSHCAKEGLQFFFLRPGPQPNLNSLLLTVQQKPQLVKSPGSERIKRVSFRTSLGKEFERPEESTLT